MSASQIEIVFFGPGYGESILVNVGDDTWIIVDSCLDDNKEPAALSFLEKRGIDVANQVKLIVATHWHDDHVKGMCAQLDKCKSAEFAISVALTNKEFIAYLIAHERQPQMKLDRGGSEMLRCLTLVKNSGRRPKLISQDRIVHLWSAESLSHGRCVQVLALSPSDAQIGDFFLRINDFIKNSLTAAPAVAEAKKRIVDPSRNDLSVATLVTVGQFSLLLGADVEEHGVMDFGWSNIVQNQKGRPPQPHLFKVAHHGSSGAHFDGLWSDILMPHPISVVTPWRIGAKSLPTDDDVCRLKKLSSEVYITGSGARAAKKRYDRQVFKLMESFAVGLETTISPTGYIRFALDPNDGKIIERELSGSAQAL